MADIQTKNIMKSMNLTYSHKELQWLFFAAVVAGLNASLRKRGYFITFRISDDSFYYECWKAASVAEKGDGEMIASHQVNKGEYQMNDIRLGVMIKYMEDEANKFMADISPLTLRDNSAEKAFLAGRSKTSWAQFNQDNESNEIHTSKEYPTEVLLEGEKEGYSEDVLIDIDGYRNKFRTGWYDFDDKTWRLHDIEAQKEIDLNHMKWTELPLNKEPLAKG
jgi:hypothetical protein